MTQRTAQWQVIPGGVTAPQGFVAAGVSAGLKVSGAPDLALIASENDAIAAAVYTQSQVRAACVDYCRQQLTQQASARAILCNSGQANACTGEQGWQDAIAMATAAARALGTESSQVLIASTGVIGQRIKIEPLVAELPQLTAQLSDQGSEAAATAILTTDLVTKSYALETTIDGRSVRVGGIAKGSGMIHPNMATMLAFITCDAAVSPALWQAMLTRAVNKSFNQITVDGDTSTNDTVIALTNGRSRTAAITAPGAAATALEAMLTELCVYLAKSIARDGEGATCLIEVNVSGCTTDEDARKIARTIASSSLVKSAIFGRDPNWGRIAGAVGRAEIPLDPAKLTIQLGPLTLMDQGQPLMFDRKVAHRYIQSCAIDHKTMLTEALSNPVCITVQIGDSHGIGQAWGCDLSYDYVKINAEYTT